MMEKCQGNPKEAKGLLIWVTLNRFNIKYKIDNNCQAGQINKG